MKRLAMVSMFAIAASSSAAAVAQTASAASAEGQVQTDSGPDIEDIIVTATKRPQSLQDTPVAVTPISEEKFKSLNVVAVSDIAQIAPSINFIAAPSPQSSQFVIRGVGTFASNDALEQSV